MHALPSLIFCVALSACSYGASGVPATGADEVMATFDSAITGCTAGLTGAGLIDQAALGGAGWQLIERKSRFETEDRDHALDSFPELQAGEYEATSWAHSNHGYGLSLTRWDEKSTPRLADSCELDARVNSNDEVEDVLAAFAKKFSRKADREGTLPRGGDFLTPRFDKASKGYYWAMPQHDIYLTVNEHNNIHLQIVAMSDRSVIDEFSHDSPERRVPSPD